MLSMKNQLAILALLACACTGNVEQPAGPSTELPAFSDAGQQPDAGHDPLVGSYVYDDGVGGRLALTLHDTSYMLQFAWPDPIAGNDVYFEAGDLYVEQDGLLHFVPLGATCSGADQTPFDWAYSLDPFTLYIGPHAFIMERIDDGPLIGTPITFGCFRDSAFVPEKYTTF